MGRDRTSSGDPMHETASRDSFDHTPSHTLALTSITIQLCWMLLFLNGCQHKEPASSPRSPEPQETIQEPTCKILPNELKIATNKDGTQNTLLCQTSNCGGNSPAVNGFPINGFDPNGCKNTQEVRLVPGSTYGNPKISCNGKTLETTRAGKQDYLTAGNCTDQDLVGTTFLVNRRSDRDGINKTVGITIKATWSISSSKSDPNAPIFHGYILTLRNDKKEISLCNRAGADNLRRTLALQNDLKFWDPPQKDERLATESNYSDDDMALVFPGELYDENGLMFPQTEGGSWFNIACARDALARLDILKIAPHAVMPADTTDQYRKKRAAALKMVTANYCNTSRYTFSGNEIIWDYRDGGKWIPGNEKGKPESIWNETGALCIGRTRLFRTIGVAGFPEELYPPNCRPRHKCQDEDGIVKALQDECKRASDSCSTEEGLFRSYPNPNFHDK
jgi:hypothetical protein